MGLLVVIGRWSPFLKLPLPPWHPGSSGKAESRARPIYIPGLRERSPGTYIAAHDLRPWPLVPCAPCARAFSSYNRATGNNEHGQDRGFSRYLLCAFWAPWGLRLRSMHASWAPAGSLLCNEIRSLRACAPALWAAWVRFPPAARPEQREETAP